ncbi:MAG: purine-binding chemotaxis protein CheW [Gammaproteobacteria bacterium]|nr:purine-binding chemotaxis protein CheW [Gammaproteobacteria bacterium]
MSLVKSMHPYELLLDMEAVCKRMAEAFPRETKSTEYWKGVGFILGGKQYVVPWGEVAEIQSLPTMTRVPGAKDWVKGVANVRGTLLPIMDLNAFFGYRGRKFRKQRLLVVKHDGIYSGLIVDEVLGAMTFEKFEEMEESPETDESTANFVVGGFSKQDIEWPVFSLHTLAEYSEFRLVSR